MTEDIKIQLQHVLDTIALASKNSGRPADSVTLLAVSKKQSTEKIRAAFHAGQKAFGENYLQEALEKQEQLRDLAIQWHFIGSIQTNKAKLIAKHFDWVQSIDRVSVAQALNKNRPDNLPAINVCIQLNIDQENSKSGINPDDIISLANEITLLPKLKLRGLMVIPKKMIDPSLQRETFSKVTKLLETLNKHGFQLDTLSMGMSDDFTPAIEAGSTMVRIGTAIFGERKS